MGCCGKIAKGASGLAKAAVRVRRDAPAFAKARRDICRACPQAQKHPTKGLTFLSRCNSCGCFIGAKTLIESESCPEGKWGPEPAQQNG